MKTITVQLLLRFASLHQTGNDLEEDPTTCGSEQPNRIGDCRISDLSSLENTAGLIVDTAMLKQMTPRSDNQIS